MTDDQPTVFVVDDDEPVLDAISLLLDTVDIPHQCYDNAQAFLADFGEHQTGCLVLDIRMPGMSGLELQDHLIEAQDTIPIIFITGHGDIPMAVEAMKKGALDFIRKPFRDQDLLDRIQEAMTWDAENREHHADLEAVRGRASLLTPREQEVFGRVAEGQANKVVAIDLEISERTVEIHRSQVMQKMEARNLASLVKMKILLDQNSD